jgi:hypothetical protein
VSGKKSAKDCRKPIQRAKSYIEDNPFISKQGFLLKAFKVLSKTVQQTAGTNGIHSCSNLPYVCDTSPWTTERERKKWML